MAYFFVAPFDRVEQRRLSEKLALAVARSSRSPIGGDHLPHSATGRNGSISRASHAAYERLSATGSAADQSLLEYQIIFENAIVGICSMRNRILLRCNRRMEQIFGFGPGELDQQPVRILYPNKEAYERIDKVYANFPRHNQYVHEPQLVRKDGRLIWCIVSGRLLDPREPAAGSIWVVQDITERRITENALRQANKRLEMRVEQRTTNLRRTNQALKVEVQRRKDMHVALVESREKYRALFRTFPIGVAITDDQGNIVEVNRALQRLTGRRDIAGIQRIGSQAGDLIKPDGGEVSRENLARVRALREHRRIEDEEVGLLLPDGSRLWFNTIAAPIPVRGYGVVATYSDVTERKQAVEREKRQQAEFSRAARLNVMGEMASALAHELGQPLSSCLNYLEGLILRLEVGTAETADIATALASARRQAERAGEIVNRVRNYVRRHRPERRIVDVNEIIRDVVSFLSFEARSQGSVVRLALAPQRLAAFVDRVEIEQVVLNLLKNAIDAVCAVPKRRRAASIAAWQAAPSASLRPPTTKPSAPPSPAAELFCLDKSEVATSGAAPPELWGHRDRGRCDRGAQVVYGVCSLDFQAGFSWLPARVLSLGEGARRIRRSAARRRQTGSLPLAKRWT